MKADLCLLRMKLLSLLRLTRSSHPRIAVRCIINKEFITNRKHSNYPSMLTNCKSFPYLASPYAQFICPFHVGIRQTNQSLEISTLDHLFTVALQNVTSYGRLSQEDVMVLIKQVKQAGIISYTQSLFLIRCLGLILSEAPTETRRNLLDEVLNILKEKNHKLDITHYNHILAVYFENEVIYNPFKFLKMLEENNILPNKVTFQKLVSSLCKRGDIPAVTEVLKIMKQSNFEVNVDILDAIVKGHSLNGDWTSAEQTIEMIKNAGLEPDSRTYCALLEGYAKHGLSAQIATVIDQCKAKDLFIRDQEILETVYVAAMNGQSGIVDYLLTLTRKDWGYNRACVNLVFRLVSEKREEAAYKVLLSMKPILSSEGRTLPSGNFFIRHLVKSGCPPEKIINFCQDLVNNGKNNKAFFKALEVATLYNDATVTSHVMRKLRGRKESAKPHLYGPLLISRARTSGEDGVLKLLWEMKSAGANATVDIVTHCILPHLTGDVQIILQKLLDSGISFYVSVMSLLQHSIDCHDFSSAVWLASNYYTGLDERLRNAVVKAYLASRDAVSLGKLIRALLPLPREIGEDDDLQDSSNHLIDSILKDICNQAPNLTDVLYPLLEALNEQGLSISVSSSHRLREVLGEQMLASLDSLLSRLESNKLLNYDCTNSDRLNVGSYMAIKGVKEFQQYVRMSDMDSALKCKELLEANNVPLSDGMNVSLLMTYVKNGKFDEALALFSEFMRHGTKIYLPNLLTFAARLLTEGRTADVVYVLDHANETRTVDFFVTEDRVRIGIMRMLNFAASQGDVELTRKLFDKLKSKTTIDRKLLSPLVKAHLVRDDLDGALDEFKRCVVEYHCAPGKTSLLEKLIEKNDEARLQTTIELSNKADGEKNSLHDLAFSYLRCGRLDKAQTVLQTPGLRALNKRLDDTFRYNGSTRRIQEMENLLKITKDLFNVDRLMLYNHMLTAYIDTDQPSKAAELWTQLQEENGVTPDESFMLKLGQFLLSRSFPVPFVMPMTITAEIRGGVS